MRFSTQLFALSAPLLVSAAPLFNRHVSEGDILVLKFAKVLEDLEAEMYGKVIQKFGAQDILDAGYKTPEAAVEQLLAIQRDETAHQSGLTAALNALGQEPVQGCTFNIDPLIPDVVTAMTVARMVEQTGVAAYAGSANLVKDPTLLTVAATILSIESRHSTSLNILNGGAAFTQPFDIALSAQEVLAIAGPVIQGCSLGIQGNTPLAVTANGLIGPDTQLTLASPAIDQAAAGGQELFCQMLVGGATTAIPLPIGECKVPAGVFGPVAIFATNSEHPLLGNVIDRAGASCVVAGPAIIFVDGGVPAQQLSRGILNDDSPLVKDLNGAPAATSSTTSTIPPADASSSVDAARTSAPPATTGAAQSSLPPPELPSTMIYQGDVQVKMPNPAADQSTETQTLTAVGSAGIPEPTGTDGGSAGVPLPTDVGSAGVPLPTDVGSAGEPAPTDTPAVDPAGGAGSSNDEITVKVPSGEA